MLLPVFILLLAIALAVLLFGDSPAVRHTAIHRLHHILSNAIDTGLSILASHDGIYSAIRWAVPVFYVAVVVFCVGWYFAAVDPLVAASIRLSPFHQLLVLVILLSVVLSFLLVTFMNPGYVTLGNVATAVRQFPDNHIIFFGRQCTTCRLPRPARAKHCSVCDRCVLLFDHHCLWVNNCIGYRNYPWFILFLVLNVTMMWYGAYLCQSALLLQKRPFGWWKLVTNTTQANRIAGTLFLVAVLMLVVTAIFALLHVRYLYLGVTTNEADKWGEIEYLVQRGLLYYVRDMNVYVEKALTRNESGDYRRVYLNLADDLVQFDEADEENHEFVRVELVERDLVNIYDQGFWENIRERIFLR